MKNNIEIIKWTEKQHILMITTKAQDNDNDTLRETKKVKYGITLVNLLCVLLTKTRQRKVQILLGEW